MSETFCEVATGTHAPGSFNYLTLFDLPNTDTVVLDGFLFEMTRDNASGPVALFQPTSDSYDADAGWNMSVEITRPNEDSTYIANGLTELAGRQSLSMQLMDSEAIVLAAVEIVAGSPINESIRVLSGLTWTSWTVADDVLPPFPNRLGAYGDKPDRYLVSFEYTPEPACLNVTVIHTRTGVVWNGPVDFPQPSLNDPPILRFDIDVHTGDYGVYNLASGWMIDNLLLRSSPSRYAFIGPASESVAKSEPVWIRVADTGGTAIVDAAVSVEGVPALFNSSTGRYEVFLDRDVDWDVPMRFSAEIDGVSVTEIVRVTTVPELQGPLSVAYWWNGWDWATVFGRDDAYYATSGDATYVGYSHPTTSYIISGFNGNSTDTLERQSEIGLHLPHDYLVWGHKNWTEAVISAEFAHSRMQDEYWFASRWDDPRYVGEGDSYISVGTPGNWASWEQMFAHFDYGSRLMGTSSRPFLAGNSSLIGSYGLAGALDPTIPSWSSWHPSSKMDLMDMYRAVSIDIDKATAERWDAAYEIAKGNGVLRIYNHGTIADADYISWLCEDKMNFTLENWKATDGEIASYVYGRWSTDAAMDERSSATAWTFKVSRKDPHESGYWNVPVTLTMDMLNRKVVDVQISTGGQVVSSANGTLASLHGSRIMDVGYDVRGDTLYVSHFWNESSTLTVYTEAATNPHILTVPDREAIVLDGYLVELRCTRADNGSTTWKLSTDAKWLEMVVINSTACVLSGTPTASGTFWANVTVRDLNTSSYLNWSIVAQKLKIVSGHIYGYDGESLGNIFVTVAVERDGVMRAFRNVTSDAAGYFTATFLESEWDSGNTLVASTVMDNSIAESSAEATELPFQQLDLRFFREPGDNIALTLLLGVLLSGIAILAVVLLRRVSKP